MLTQSSRFASDQFMWPGQHALKLAKDRDETTGLQVAEAMLAWLIK